MDHLFPSYLLLTQIKITLMKFLSRPILVMLFMATGTLTAFSQSKARKMILAEMREEEACWNRGDIEAYVKLFAPGDSTRMIYKGGAGITYGRDSILAFYKKYWPKEKMGRLQLDGESIERISRKYYYVSGFFHVYLPDGKKSEGRFSGLMRKIKGKWYVYTDHSG